MSFIASKTRKEYSGFFTRVAVVSNPTEMCGWLGMGRGLDTTTSARSWIFQNLLKEGGRQKEVKTHGSRAHLHLFCHG